jgi:outer membrane protein TolC
MDTETPQYKMMEKQLISELKSMTKGEFEIRFTKRIVTDWSISKTQSALETLQNDSEIDMVIMTGLVSANVAFQKKKLKKPTFAPYLLDFNNSSNKVYTGSSRHNLNYLLFGSPFDIALQNFLSVTSFKNMTLITESKISAVFPGAVEEMQNIASNKGIKLNIVICTPEMNDSFVQVPSDTETVMVTPLPSLNAQSKKMLLEKLLERHIPSYSLGDDLTVDDGMMMSSLSTENRSRRIRRLALNIHSVLRGTSPEALSILFDEKDQLTINLTTANMIGVYPPFDVLNRAKLIGSDKYSKADALSLSDVAKLAIKNNLHIIVGKLGVQSEDENINEVRSVLLPQISGNLSYMQQNSDNVFVENGFYAQKSSSGAIKLHQILFSEKALGALEIQKKMKAATEAQQRTLEMDIIERATTIFLNTLIAQTYLNVEIENLKLTQANLELARGRVDAGVSDLSDIYHWESRIATSRQRVLESKATLKKSHDALNLILNRPIAHSIKTVPASLNEPYLIISHKALLSMITNENDLKLINDFFVKVGVKNASELYMYNHKIAAQIRKLESNRRAYIYPELVFTGEVSHVFDEQRNPLSGFSLEDQTNWQAGVILSLPLFEGGAKNARLSRSQIGLQQLKTAQLEQRNLIEQQVRQDLHEIRSSYPSIELSKQAAIAARKSFELVQNNYAEGTRAMTDLLVAQNASLLAEQASATAVYKFLIDLMLLQRDTGQFDFFMNDEERTSLVEQLSSLIMNSRNKVNQTSKAEENE